MDGRVARSSVRCGAEHCKSTDFRYCSVQDRCESCSPSTCHVDVCGKWPGCQDGTTAPDDQNLLNHSASCAESVSAREVTAWVLVFVLFLALVLVTLKAISMFHRIKKYQKGDLTPIEMQAIRRPSHSQEISDLEAQGLLPQGRGHPPAQPSVHTLPTHQPTKCSSCACERARRMGGSQRQSCPNIIVPVQEGHAICHPDDWSRRPTTSQMGL